MDAISRFFKGFYTTQPATDPENRPTVLPPAAAAAAAFIKPFQRGQSLDPKSIKALSISIPVLCGKISALSEVDHPNPAELGNILNDAETLFDNPNLRLKDFDRDDIIITLYNALGRLSGDELASLVKEPKLQLSYDKLIREVYNQFQIGMLLHSREASTAFYVQLLHQAVTSPSFTLLYNKAAFFPILEAFFDDQDPSIMDDTTAPLIQTLLEKQLQYLALIPEADRHTLGLADEQIRTTVRRYFDFFKRLFDENSLPVEIRLSIAILQTLYADLNRITNLFSPKSRYDLAQLSRHRDPISILQGWIAKSNSTDEEILKYRGIIEQALEMKIIDHRDALKLQKYLLSKKIIANKSTTSVKDSLSTILEAAKSLKKGVGLNFLQTAIDFRNESDRYLKAIDDVIHREEFFNTDMRNLIQDASKLIYQYKTHYEKTINDILTSRAICKIDADFSQFTLPSINIKKEPTVGHREHPGRGACLPIAVYTCNMLLKGQVQDPQDLQEAMHRGISRYQDIIMQAGLEEGYYLHAEDYLNSESSEVDSKFSQIVRKIEPEDYLNNQFQLVKGEEKEVYKRSLEFLRHESTRLTDNKIAAIIRIRSSFLSILLDKSIGPSIITIADSHGIRGSNAYAYTFSSPEDAAKFLANAYPHIEDEDRHAGDPLNSIAVNVVTLPEHDVPIDADLTFAKTARSKTSQVPYTTDIRRRRPLFPSSLRIAQNASASAAKRDEIDGHPAYKIVSKIVTGEGTDPEKLKALSDALVPIKHELPSDLFKRPKNPDESIEEYQAFLIQYYRGVALKHLFPEV